MTFYTEKYKNDLISKMADTIIELKEIAKLPQDDDVVIFFLKRFKVEDFSKLTEDKVLLFKVKLKELYEQVERWKEIDSETHASIFRAEGSVSYPPLDELYELVDSLIHQNHNPPGGTNTTNLNREEIGVIRYTYLEWVRHLLRCNERYTKRFIEDCNRVNEEEMKAYRESLGDSLPPPRKPTKEEIREIAKDLAIAIYSRKQEQDGVSDDTHG